MLIDLFEDTPIENILSPALGEMLALWPDDWFREHWRKSSLIDTFGNDARIASKLKTDPQRVAFMLYSRAFIISLLPVGENPEQRLPKDVLHFYKRTRQKCEPFLERLKWQRGINFITPSAVFTRLEHFKGSNVGGDGLPIPAIRAFRIEPNTYLPDAIQQMEAIEAAWNQEQLDRIDHPADAKFRYFHEVPDDYIPYDRQIVTPIKMYEEGGVKSGWYNLKGNSNPDEAKAMGHCASNSKADTLYSFRTTREFFILEAGGVKSFYRPLLTAAVRGETLLELRGRANSKPGAKFHPYIIDLMRTLGINDIRPSDYRRSDQFLYTDLSEEDQRSLEDLFPEGANGTRSDEWKYFNRKSVSEDAWEEAQGEVHHRIEEKMGTIIAVSNDDPYNLTIETSMTVGEVLTIGLDWMEGKRYNDVKVFRGYGNRAKEILHILQVEAFDDDDFEPDDKISIDKIEVERMVDLSIPDVVASFQDTILINDPTIKLIRKALLSKGKVREPVINQIRETMISLCMGRTAPTTPEMKKFIDAMWDLYQSIDISDSSTYSSGFLSKDDRDFNKPALIMLNADDEYGQLEESGAELEDYDGKYWWLYDFDPTTNNLGDRYYDKDAQQQLINAIDGVKLGTLMDHNSIEILFANPLPGMKPEFVKDPVTLLRPYLEQDFKSFPWLKYSKKKKKPPTPLEGTPPQT